MPEAWITVTKISGYSFHKMVEPVTLQCGNGGAMWNFKTMKEKLSFYDVKSKSKFESDVALTPLK